MGGVIIHYSGSGWTRVVGKEGVVGGRVHWYVKTTNFDVIRKVVHGKD